MEGQRSGRYAVSTNDAHKRNREPPQQNQIHACGKKALTVLKVDYLIMNSGKKSLFDSLAAFMQAPIGFLFRQEKKENVDSLI